MPVPAAAALPRVLSWPNDIDYPPRAYCPRGSTAATQAICDVNALEGPVDDPGIEDELMDGPAGANYPAEGSGTFVRTNRGWRMEYAQWIH